MKRVVVTGASGFIGKALTNRLLELGEQVYAVTERPDCYSDDRSENLIVVKCDFSQYATLANIIPYGIDQFVHLAWAGVSGPQSKNIIAQGENIRASAVAMEQAEKLGVKRFLFAGSSYQYRMEPVIRDGQELFLLKNIYGSAKAAGNRLLQAAALDYGIEYNSVLFTNVFGVGDYSKRSTNSLLRQLLAGEDLNLISGEHLHDWTYIDDAVNGIIAILTHGNNGVDYYVGSKKLRTFREIVTQVRDVVAPKAKLRFGYYNDKSYIDYRKIDIKALYHDTGFACQNNFEESVLKTARWLVSL